MNTQLAKIVSQFEEHRARLHRLADATPGDRWAVRADPQRWSVAECVAHLNLTSQAFVPLIRAALEQGRGMSAPNAGRYRLDAAGWFLSLFSGPMLRIGNFRFGRFRTPPAFVPGGDLERDASIAEFDRLQTEQIVLTRAADGLPLNDLHIVSPFDARVRYNVYSALVVLPRHQARHLEQAEDVWGGR